MNRSDDPQFIDPVDAEGPLTLGEYTQMLEEIHLQPPWRATADKEMDYADGNQLDTELLQAQKARGVPPAMEDLIGPALLAIQGYEATTRTDWRVTPNGQPEGRDVADALNFKLNEAERHSQADEACSEAFRPQIAVGLGWVEVARESDPFKFKYRCRATHRNEIHWDMAGGSADPQEWRYLRRTRWLHPSRLAKTFPQHADLIRAIGRSGPDWHSTATALDSEGGWSTGLRNAWNEARGWSIQEDRWYNPMSKEVCLAELWYRRWESAIVLTSPDGRVVEYDENNPAHTYALASGTTKYERAVVTRVRRSYWLGPHCLFDGPTPYPHRHFPYVPFFGFREDSTAVPYGYVRGVIFQQDSLNSGTAAMRWGITAYRTERTKGAVDMTDEQYRREVGRRNADIVLNAAHMAQSGARYEVKRDAELTSQQLQMMNDARAAIERMSSAPHAFVGKAGTATSGLQEQTQVEQANQSLGHVMGNFRKGRTLVGELLLAMIVQDMGQEQHAVVIEGDAVSQERTIQLNQPATDPATGYAYLSNDLQRTRLMVALEDVPSTTSYRGQQLNALSEATKAMPPQYQAIMAQYIVALTDIPFKDKIAEALRAASQQETPEQIERRIAQAVQDALARSGVEVKMRELALKERRAEPEIQKLLAEAVQIGVQSAFSAMQAGAQVAMSPMIAPIADKVMQGAGYQRPNPAGVDPDFAVPTGAVPVEGAGAMVGVALNTHPEFPATPQQPQHGVRGLQTAATGDNLPAVA